MSQRISEMTPVSSLNGDELVEVAVPDNESSTGFVTRHAQASLFGGNSGSLPYRFTFEYENYNLNSDLSFSISFNKSDFDSTAFRPNANTDPDGIWKLSNAIMNFNAIVGFKSAFAEGPNQYARFAPLNSTVWVNKMGSAIGSDSDLLRYGSFNNTNDFDIFEIPSNYPTVNYMYTTPVIAPTEVYEDGNEGGLIVVRFRVVSPYDSWGTDFPIYFSIKGYADINMAFSNFLTT